MGAWAVRPQVLLQVSPSAPCTRPFPGCVSPSADEALSIFQDPSPPSGPSSKPQHLALPLMVGTPGAEHIPRGLSWACALLHPSPSAPGPHALHSAGPTLGLESSIYQLSWLHHELLLQGRDPLLPICVTHPRWSRRPAYRADVLTEGPEPGTTQVPAEITSNRGGEG